MSNPSLKYRADIDGLRAVAVLSVVAFHASSRLLSGGFVGFDIFFVISGYLISKIILSELKDGTFSFWHFYSRRIRRIFPALILVLASSWAAGYIWLPPSDYESLGKHIVAGAGFVANFGYWQETGYFDTASDLKPLLHLWSLGVEEQFYVVWPIILLASWRFLGNFGRVIVVALVASFAMNVVLIQSDPADAFYLPVSRFWELLVGGGLAWLSISQNASSFSVSEKARHAISIAGAILILVALFGVNKAMLFPGWWALLPVVGAALLIFAGPAAIVNKQVLSRQPVVFVGLISYPLYLWHWPMFAFTRIAGYDFKYRAAATVLAFVLSYLTYRYFEQPIRSGTLKTNRKVPIILSILIFCIGCVGAATYQSAGYAKRFPDYIANVIRYDKTFDLGVWRSGTCFNLKTADYEHNFAEVCKGDIVQSKDGGVFLWGDSIAASLYPGLAKVQAERGRALAQYTTSNCPPFLEFDDPNNKHCRSVNQFVTKTIAEVKPETVILSGYWIKYTKYYYQSASDYNVPELLASTVAFLRAQGVKRIIVLGPLPLWRPELPKTLFSQWAIHRELPPPVMSSIGLDASSFPFDEEMAAKVRPLGVEYVSAMEILCDGKACMTRVGEDWRDLSTFDTMHLTEPGAYFLAKRIFSQTSKRDSR